MLQELLDHKWKSWSQLFQVIIDAIFIHITLELAEMFKAIKGNYDETS